MLHPAFDSVCPRSSVRPWRFSACAAGKTGALAQTADSFEERVRDASKAGMASYEQCKDGICLGTLSTIWESQQKYKANLSCVECAGCYDGKGRRLRVEASITMDAEVVRLQIFASGVPRLHEVLLVPVKC